MPDRSVVIVAAAVTAAAVVGGAMMLADEKPRAPEPTAAPPVVLEDASAARPPQFPPVTSDAERIVQWVHTFQTGADDDVAWAASRLRTAGPEGRRAVRDAAQVAIESNPALVEQALDFLAAAPDDADVPFARAALSCRDAEAVRRAMRLLGAHPGRDAGESARAIAAAAMTGSRNVRLEALTALSKIGGDVAAEEALRVIRDSPAADAAAGYGAISGLSSDRLHAALLASFGSETNLAVRFAIADALVTGGDPTPEAWVESLVRSPPPGPLDYADAALGVLAKLQSPLALERIGATLADPLGGTDARVMAARRLQSYPIEARRAWLEAAATSAAAGDDDVKLEALESLVRAGAPRAFETLTKFIREGDDRFASVAALVCGRVRRPETAPALTEAIRRKDLADDTRALCLRALVLSGAGDAAETIARAIAADTGPQDAPVSMAHNAVAMLGEAGPEYRAVLGRQFLRALGGEFGALSGAGLVETIRAAGLCCGPEAAAALAARLNDPGATVRANAALALGYAAGTDSERDLRAAWWHAQDAGARATIAQAMERAHYRALPPVR
jgi:HEAT repeat protein